MLVKQARQGKKVFIFGLLFEGVIFPVCCKCKLHCKQVSGFVCPSQRQKGWQLWGDVWDAEGPGGLQEPEPGGHGASPGEDEGPPHR